MLLLIRNWSLLPLWDSVIVLCFVVRYFVSILVLQSSRWVRESRLLCFVYFPVLLFLAVPWVCLQFVIGVFSDHTHLLFLVWMFKEPFYWNGCIEYP